VYFMLGTVLIKKNRGKILCYHFNGSNCHRSNWRPEWYKRTLVVGLCWSSIRSASGFISKAHIVIPTLATYRKILWNKTNMGSNFRSSWNPPASTVINPHIDHGNSGHGVFTTKVCHLGQEPPHLILTGTASNSLFFKLTGISGVLYPWGAGAWEE
jgi:hypothetical protein